MKHPEKRLDPAAGWEGYTVHDDRGRRIGKVRSVCPGEGGEPEFFLVRLGLFEESYALVPADISDVVRERGTVEVAASRKKVVAGSGPVFADRRMSEDCKELARTYYGLRSAANLRPMQARDTSRRAQRASGEAREQAEREAREQALAG